MSSGCLFRPQTEDRGTLVAIAQHMNPGSQLHPLTNDKETLIEIVKA